MELSSSGMIKFADAGQQSGSAVDICKGILIYMVGSYQIGYTYNARRNAFHAFTGVECRSKEAVTCEYRSSFRRGGCCPRLHRQLHAIGTL